MLQIYGLRAAVVLRQMLAIGLMLFSGICRSQSLLIPEPYGGWQGMQDLISAELNYPQDALENGVKGDVLISFHVLADGTVENHEIWRGLTPSCDAEALRLAELVQWYPARLGDECVSVKHSMVVEFDPKRYRKWKRKRSRPDEDLLNFPARADATIYPATQVEKPPAPVVPENFHGFPDWWRKNLRYPADARRLGIQGELKVRFIVEPSGYISNLHAVYDLGGGCVQEAFRLLRSLPWRPGLMNEERVRSQVELDIFFKLP